MLINSIYVMVGNPLDFHVVGVLTTASIFLQALWKRSFSSIGNNKWRFQPRCFLQTVK